MKNEDVDVLDLTVIIPVYNVENYLSDAINSVIALNPRPAQIVIVNDGSTDSSLEILNLEFAKYNFIEIHSTNNNGLGIARNIGTSLARCKYVYYFDSDDLLVQGLTEAFLQALKVSSELDIFAFSAKSFYDVDGKNVKNMRKLPSYSRGVEGSFETGEDCFIELSKNNTFYPNAWMYIFRKDIVQRSSLKFKPIIHEDEDFTPQLFFKAKATYVSNSVFFLRRIRKGSIMQSQFTVKNIIGYVEAITSQGDLLVTSCSNLTAKKALLQRIRANLINILSIQRNSNITPSNEVNGRVLTLFEKFASPLEKIAINNFIVYKVINIPVKIFRKLTHR
ncbi:glycosyltransferase family 2 protein [Serratia proteamaculans]|uniref:Glycosyltransferase family 2 protein n=1 Tax=Serratia proteamaculans TaxID=28151 RepID=A0ABS0TX05_SERPR|nr:glycosyltransferase family A protein [Serratia proteamaculans]MBI6182897.1 glycosyltransferase family 2 protein [Serratia proteamaculans]